MLWAVVNQTAAEIINSRADADKSNMGLLSYEGKRLKPADITVAKNYLDKNELERLERLTLLFLDYAELQALNRHPMTMQDWAEALDNILSLNKMQILKDKGKIAKELADSKAKKEYAKYEKNRIEQEKLKSEEEFIKEIEKLSIRKNNLKS